MWKSEPIWGKTVMDIQKERKHVLQMKHWRLENKKSIQQDIFPDLFFSNHHSKLFFWKNKAVFPPALLGWALYPQPLFAFQFHKRAQYYWWYLPKNLTKLTSNFRGSPPRYLLEFAKHPVPLNLSANFWPCLAHKMMPTFMALFNSSGKQSLHQDEINGSLCIAKGWLNTVRRVFSAISTPMVEHCKSVTVV